MAAIYPKAVSTWTPRIDEVDIVWANDPNSLAAEIIATENTLGPMPHVESKPVVGNPISYPNVSARITDTFLGNQHPYVELSTSSFYTYYSSTGFDHGQYVNFRAAYDSHGYFNGSDITIKADGLYLIDSYVTWEYYNSGYVMSFIVINGVNSKSDRWSWNDFSRSGPSDANYGGRWATTQPMWMGSLRAGTRVRIMAENGTPKNPYQVMNAYVRCYYLRALPSTVSTNAGL